jgi:hypothetical protein
MRWYFYLLLGFSGLALALAVGHFQQSPGYMDADYYFAGGVQLAKGRGFSEMVLWNYLDNPTGLPHPSHAYWMPLASILAAVGMGLTGSMSMTAARTGFLLVTALIPPMTALLSYKITARNGLALASGVFAVFSGYYIPFFSTADTFALYMVFGAGFMLLIGYGIENNDGKHRTLISAALGVVAGFAHLSRADGIMWLAVAFLTVIFIPRSNNKQRIGLLIFVLMGYAIVMTPWFLRNFSEFGTLLAPGGNHTLWLTRYDETYSYPASKLTLDSWLSSGWISILGTRFDALKWNLQTAWAVQGAIFLLPFIVIGGWVYRRDLRIQIGMIAWLISFAVMTLIFPFAGSRGGFLHSGAALQPLWWVLAPVGIERFVLWLEVNRNWRKGEAFRVLMIGFIGVSILMTAAIFYVRVYSPPGWGYEARRYRRVEDTIILSQASISDIVMVGNPPGYFNVSNRPAIAIPNEPLSTVLEVADKFDARFLVLEEDGVPLPLKLVYDNPTGFPSILYLGEIDGARIFAIP